MSSGHVHSEASAVQPSFFGVGTLSGTNTQLDPLSIHYTLNACIEEVASKLLQALCSNDLSSRGSLQPPQTGADDQTERRRLRIRPRTGCGCGYKAFLHGLTLQRPKLWTEPLRKRAISSELDSSDHVGPGFSRCS